MSNANPFEEEEAEPAADDESPSVLTSGSTPIHCDRASIDAIASRLLEENYVLTALELHTELTESGRECKRLRDFFSNPVNFEANYSDANLLGTEPPLNRTSSNQTLDSLDFARYSDDASNVADDPSAVVEFELRKARETIKSLREQLTQASEQGLTSLDSSVVLPRSESVVTVTADALPHEKRALNFLVHEYLLHSGCRLTSVSLSDEIVDQDMDDWDDVGLNIPTPPHLLALFREFARHNNLTAAGVDNVTQTDCDIVDDLSMTEFDKSSDVQHLISRLNEENSTLLKFNSNLESEIIQLKAEIEKMEKQAASISKSQSSTEIRRMAELKIRQPSNIPNEELNSEDMQRKPSPSNVCTKVECILRKGDFDKDLLQLEIDNPPGTMAELMDHLCVSLPNLLPNILLNKRHEVLPLLVCACLHAKEGVARDGLMNNLFNIVKKPEDDQRTRIVCACVSFCKLAGPIRAEAELLPQCWQQMGDKNTERRLLVAETCGAVAGLLPGQLVSSLVVSILQQMLTSDKCDRVRLAAVHSLANVCLYINDRDKFPMLNDSCARCVLDSSALVAGDSRRILLPCLAIWAHQLGKLQLGVVSMYTSKTMHILKTSGVSQQANSTVLCSYIESIEATIASLYYSVITSAPFANEAKSDLQCIASNLKDDRYPMADDFIYGVTDLFASLDSIEVLTAAFDRHTEKEWFKTWDTLDYVLKELVVEIVNMAELVEIDLNRVVVQLTKAVRNLTVTFGRGFAMNKIVPAFQHAITQKPESACLPVFIIGVLCAFPSEKSWSEIRKLLRTRLSNVLDDNPTYILCNTVTFKLLLRESWIDPDNAVGVVHELVAHGSASVRRGCAHLLCACVPSLPHSLIKAKILPALVTLSSDPDLEVRCTTFEGLRAIMELSVADCEMQDKVRMQVHSLFEEGDPLVLPPLVNSLARSVSTLQESLRNHFVLSELACLCGRLAQQPAGSRDAQLVNALFSGFSAMSVCYIPPQVLSDTFIPGLRALLCSTDAEHSKVLQSILRESESKLMEHMNNDGLGRGAGEYGDEIGARMMSKLKDLKGRMDLQKDSVQHMFKKK